MFLFQWWKTALEYAPITGTVMSGIDAVHEFIDGNITSGFVETGVTLVSAAMDVAAVVAIIGTEGAGTPVAIGLEQAGKTGVRAFFKNLAKKWGVKTAENIIKEETKEVVEQTAKDIVKRNTKWMIKNYTLTGMEKEGLNVIKTTAEKEGYDVIKKSIEKNVVEKLEKLSEKKLQKLARKELGKDVVKKLSAKEMKEKLIESQINKQMRMPFKHLYPNLFDRVETGFFTQFKQLANPKKLGLDFVDAAKWWLPKSLTWGEMLSPLKKSWIITTKQPIRLFGRNFIKSTGQSMTLGLDMVVPTKTTKEKQVPPTKQQNKKQDKQTNQNNQQQQNQYTPPKENKQQAPPQQNQPLDQKKVIRPKINF